MATTRWTNEILAQARQEGDPTVDPLAEEVMRHEHERLGIAGYNHLLELAEVLIASPELALAGDSQLRIDLEQLYRSDKRIVNYYGPMQAPAPDWIDEKKLKIAASIWEDNTLAIIAILYALSLPSCYLVKEGVPALYGTQKLARRQYIYQRMYETGLMLDRVMERRGIRLVPDYKTNQQELLVEVLNDLDPKGQWKRQGFEIARGIGVGQTEVDFERRVKQELSRRLVAKRYLWGTGYIAAKKVRFLHASIRFKLLQPGRALSQVGRVEEATTFVDAVNSRSQEDVIWDTGKLGIPINQKDMAFVILTFGYLIPRGLERWGCRLSLEQKEAFLHLWRVVGYIMGVREDLLTDDWNEAKQFHDHFLEQNGGHTEAGEAMTAAAMDFLQEYLPDHRGIGEVVSAQLIIDQLGVDRAKLIIPEDNFRAARKPARRLLAFVAFTLLRVYYRWREGVFRKIPFFSHVTFSLLHGASEQLIASWRGMLQRKPFDLSPQRDSWRPARGATPELKEKLMAWRRKIFNTLALAILFLFASMASLIITALSPLLWSWHTAGIWALIAGGCALVSWAVMRFRLPSIFNKRPKPETLLPEGETIPETTASSTG